MNVTTPYDSYFPKMIGQERVKADLAFRLDAFRRNRYFPPTLLEGPRGFGKTDFMKSIMARLVSETLTTEDKDKDGNIIGTKPAPKPYKLINGASLKKISSLVDDVIVPFQGAECTIAIDEVHAADSNVLDWLLSVISPNTERRSYAIFNGAEFEFDFTLQSFLFATTNAEKLKDPFKSRCNRVAFEPYKIEELAEIIRRVVAKDDLIFEDDADIALAGIARSTPREAVKRAQDAVAFAAVNDKTTFGRGDMIAFCRRLKVRPMGLSPLEHQALTTLKENGSMTLTALSSALRLDPQTIRRDVEKFLLEIGAIRIDGPRSITGKGVDLLAQCAEIEKAG